MSEAYWNSVGQKNEGKTKDFAERMILSRVHLWSSNVISYGVEKLQPGFLKRVLKCSTSFVLEISNMSFNTQMALKCSSCVCCVCVIDFPTFNTG